MLFVPVVSKSNEPMMPCHPARARELVGKGRAKRRFNRGIFYIKLLDREKGNVQPVAVGIDPGSKKEGYTVKSKEHTFLNIQADAITWVKDAMRVRRSMRRTRRNRNTPCRKCKHNRHKKWLSPSNMARWQWKLRICTWLSKLYPIEMFVVEDIKAHSHGGRRWNAIFSPLQTGKNWFYNKLIKLSLVSTKLGYETKELRDKLGLHKSSRKLIENFYAHCVDSWVLANSYTGSKLGVDNTNIMCVVPLRFNRRQLHMLQPFKGGIRKRQGGTISNGLKRGSWVKHKKYNIVYVGGFLKDRVSLHDMGSGKRLCQNAKPSDCKILTYSSWRVYSGN